MRRLGNGDLLNPDTETLQPSSAGRTCTDIVWVPIFIVALGLLGCVLSHASQHGDVHRLYALPDFEGRLCGRGGRGPYAYLCGAQVPGSLDWHKRVCVEVCPTSNGTSLACSRFDNDPAEIADYPTYAFAGILCMPLDRSFTQQLLAGHPTAERLNLESAAVWADLRRARWLLLLAAALAVALAYAYLSSLQLFAECVLRFGCLVAVLAPGALGGCMLYSSLQHEPAGALGDAGPASKFIGSAGLTSGDLRIDAVVGTLGALVSLFLACVACFWDTQISLAIECLDKASSCITSYPSLLWQPFLSLALKVAALGPMLVGFVQLLSCLMDEEPAAAGTPVIVANDVAPSHIWEYTYIVYYCIMMVWVFELCSAISHFVVAYNVQGWYFAGRHSIQALSGLAHGYCLGLCNHFGSLLLGSACIPLARPFRRFVAPLQHVHRNAYMEVALSSKGFCEAAHQAQEVSESNAVARKTLAGAAFLFVMAGLAGIGAAGASLTWWACRTWSVFAEPTSLFYIEEPFYPCCAAAVLGLLMAWPFLGTLDAVGDCILFCEGVEALAAEDEGDEELEGEGVGCCSVWGCARTPAQPPRGRYAMVPQSDAAEE